MFFLFKVPASCFEQFSLLWALPNTSCFKHLFLGSNISLTTIVYKIRCHWSRKHPELLPCDESLKYQQLAMDDDIFSTVSRDSNFVDPTFIFCGPFQEWRQQENNCSWFILLGDFHSSFAVLLTKRVQLTTQFSLIEDG